MKALATGGKYVAYDTAGLAGKLAGLGRFL
jgi:hypothetical protein